MQLVTNHSNLLAMTPLSEGNPVYEDKFFGKQSSHYKRTQSTNILADDACWLSWTA